jgi:hypothetical protein
MVVIDLLKGIDEDYICISKKIGLYLKNSDKGDLYICVKDIVEENYINDLDKNINFRTELIEYLNDPYYKNEIKKDISKYNNKQLISLITKKMLVLEIEASEDTVIVDDEIFERCDEEHIAEVLRNHPLINPIDEYDIEYKMLFLFNFLRKDSEKRNDIDIVYYNGYSTDNLYNGEHILDSLISKSYKKREKHEYLGYQYYKNSNEEYTKKILSLIEFGKEIDKYIDEAEDYFKLDFIIETLLYGENYMYSLLNYIQLIEMLIVNPQHSTREQFKQKLKYFIDMNELENREQIENFSAKLYDIRSRLIHGNYNSLKKELIDFNKKFTRNTNYDYGEFKEENWIIINISFITKRILRNIIETMLKDKNKLYMFKMDNISEI